MIKPEDLLIDESDWSKSIVLDGQYDTLKRTVDVAKRHVNGTHLVIIGLENQQYINYGMPVRMMMSDLLGYFRGIKERKGLGEFKDVDEFLSKIAKEDRFAPVLTLCVYYGSKPWDGPMCLTDMLDIPEWVRPYVNNYHMNFIQVSDSDKLKFSNKDVHMLFEILRNTIKFGLEDAVMKYGNKVKSEISLAVGAVTGAKEFIEEGLKRKGEGVNMYEAVTRIKEDSVNEGIAIGKDIGRSEGIEIGRSEGIDIGRREGIDIGRSEGKAESISKFVKLCREMNFDIQSSIRRVSRDFDISEAEAALHVNQHWE